jgi:hypothetical protein
MQEYEELLHVMQCFHRQTWVKWIEKWQPHAQTKLLHLSMKKKAQCHFEMICG